MEKAAGCKSARRRPPRTPPGVENVATVASAATTRREDTTVVERLKQIGITAFVLLMPFIGSIEDVRL